MEEIQHTVDIKDSKTMYDLLTVVFGPTRSRITSLKTKDGSISISDPAELMGRWTEHYTDLFTNPSRLNENVINNLPQYDLARNLTQSLLWLKSRKSLLKCVLARLLGLMVFLQW